MLPVLLQLYVAASLLQEPAARAITQEALSGADAALDAIARQLPALVQHLLIKQRHGEALPSSKLAQAWAAACWLPSVVQRLVDSLCDNVPSGVHMHGTTAVLDSTHVLLLLQSRHTLLSDGLHNSIHAKVHL